MDHVNLKPIGTLTTSATEIPRHWRVSQVEGTIEIEPEYQAGLKDLEAGQDIIVLFHFHQSPPFTSDALIQFPPHHPQPRGVFSICSPLRPNPIGHSVLHVIAIDGCSIRVRRVDMRDGTPILDIKPYLPLEPDTPS